MKQRHQLLSEAHIYLTQNPEDGGTPRNGRLDVSKPAHELCPALRC